MAYIQKLEQELLGIKGAANTHARLRQIEKSLASMRETLQQLEAAGEERNRALIDHYKRQQINILNGTNQIPLQQVARPDDDDPLAQGGGATGLPAGGGSKGGRGAAKKPRRKNG